MSNSIHPGKLLSFPDPSPHATSIRAKALIFSDPRSVALLQVKVLLARLGEVDRLAQLERLPFERKIEQLEGYLQEAGGQKTAAP